MKAKTLVFDVIKFLQGPVGLRGLEFQLRILGIVGSYCGAVRVPVYSDVKERDRAAIEGKASLSSSTSAHGARI